MKRNVQDANTSTPALTVYTLGRFAVYLGDTAIDDSAWQRQKAKKLFKLLLLAPQRLLLKDQVFELLWPEKTPEAAANNLHRTLFILRRVLQPDLENAAKSPYILFKDDCLILNPSIIGWVDAEIFEHLSQLGRQEQHNPKHYQAALELYKGEFLPEDLYEDWAADRRGALRKSYIDILKHLAAFYTQSSTYQQAMECLHTLLQVEPTDEGVQRALMKLYAQTGERHAALRLYQHSSQVVRAEFGVEPSAETTALYEAILGEAVPPGADGMVLPGGMEHSQDGAESSGQEVLVGREPEMQELVAYLRRAQHGHGSVVFIAGEQGVGKSRLGDELAAHAQRNHIRILKGAVFESEGQLLYALFVGAIRSGLTPQIIERIQQRLGPLTTDLARLLPEIAHGLPSKHHRQEPELGRLDIETGSQERQRLFDAFAATFTTFAQTTSLLVIFDNLHVAGESSLQLLHYLARQIAHQRILFVCLVDQDKLHRGLPITLTLGELRRNHLANRLNLERLSPDQVALLCAHLLDASVYGSNIPAVVHELTEGNPFFVRELVLSLTRTGKIERRGNAWQLLPEAMSFIPSSVQEIIGTRLGQLSNDAYRLLGVAAVIGNEFSVQMLQAATKWDPGKLFDALDELRSEALVRSNHTTYRFQHAMIRQVVYQDLSAERCAWMHQQVAQALELLVASHSDEQANLLAFHYEHAGSYLAAVQYLIRAGDWARRAYALREALAHYDRAIEIGRQYPDAVDTATTISLLERRSQTYLALSNFDSAIEDLEHLLKTYQNTDQQRMAGATLYRIGFAHYWAHRLMKATMYLDQALYLAEMLDYSELRNRALRLRDILNSTQGQIADSPIVEADLPGDAAQPPQFQAEELWGYAMLAHLRYDFAMAQHRAQACITAGTATSNTFLALGGYFILGMSQASLGDYQEALNALLRALKLSETTGDRFWRARLLNTIGWVYRDLFNLDLALQYDQASLELARTNTPRLTEAEGNALANLATVYWHMGRCDQARAYMNEGLALSVNEPFMRWRYSTRLVIMQGRLALVDGDLAAAWEATEKSLDLARNTKSRKNIARSCLLRGKVLQARGEVDSARAAVRHALSVAQKLQTLGLTWTCHLALAELERADRQDQAAQLHYDSALTIVEQIADRLTDLALRERFLDSAPVQKLLAYKQAAI
jgi:predicted ATPase/DNA-binding SARP family transcriptional activator